MDGRGRVFDNIFIERLWRTIKYEEVYIHDYQSVHECQAGLERYFEFYNRERFHSSLGNLTPMEVYVKQQPVSQSQVDFRPDALNTPSFFVQ